MFSSDNVPNISSVCGSTIYPSRFIKASTAADFRVLQAAADTDKIIGVSQMGTKAAPISGATTYAGTTGDPIQAYGVNKQCYIQLGSACTRGSLLTSDADGKAVPAATGDWFGGTLLESGSADELCRMLVHTGELN